jgi:hypothetical protein
MFLIPPPILAAPAIAGAAHNAINNNYYGVQSCILVALTVVQVLGIIVSIYFIYKSLRY